VFCCTEPIDTVGIVRTIFMFFERDLNMKKLLLVMLMTSMLIFIGCGENKDEGVFQATGKTLDNTVDKAGQTAGNAVDATGNFLKKTTDKTTSFLKGKKKTDDANTVKDVNTVKK